MIIVPFLGHLSFETRNRLNWCIRHQLPSCSFRIAFQSKNCLSNLFKFKGSIPKYLCLHLFYKFSCSCCNTTYYGETETPFCTSIRASGNHSTDTNGLKIPKSLLLCTKFYLKVIMLHKMIFQFSFLKKNPFKLHLKESLLIERDTLGLYRNIYAHPLKIVA